MGFLLNPADESWCNEVAPFRHASPSYRAGHKRPRKLPAGSKNRRHDGPHIGGSRFAGAHGDAGRLFQQGVIEGSGVPGHGAAARKRDGVIVIAAHGRHFVAILAISGGGIREH